MSEQAATQSAVPRGRLVVRAVLRTDVGLVRSENQDFGTLTTPQEERASHPGGRLLIVADGMGGHRGGATASRLAGETVKTQYLTSEATDVASALKDALTRANARIFAEAQANADLRGMGTTTSALALVEGKGWFAHVGDSRIYMVRNDEIRQLTDDHSLVASMVREGLLTAKEAETHPRRNVLQRSMGVAEDVEIDVSGPIDIKEGDIFILCSDGLHGLVREPEIKDVATKMPIDEAADEFVKRALERGAPDNVTVIVARVERASDYDATLVERGEESASAYDETIRESDDHAAHPPVHPAPPFDMNDGASTFEPVARPFNARDNTMPVPALTLGKEKTAPPVAPTKEVPSPAYPRDTPPGGMQRPTTSPGTKRVPSTPKQPVYAPDVPIEPGGRAAVIWWIVVIIVLLGAAGAWYYWIR
jgi:PPM family protein phosphatase